MKSFDVFSQNMKVETAQPTPSFRIYSPGSNHTKEANTISKKAMKVLQHTKKHGACLYAHFKQKLPILIKKC